MKKSYSVSNWLYFIIPSILGAFLFMTPLKTEEGWKVPIAMLASWLDGIVVDLIEPFALLIFAVAAIGSLFKLFTPEPAQRTFSDQLFRVHWFWIITRVLAFVFAAMVYFGFGPEMITSGDTGALLFAGGGGLVTFLFVIFLFAGIVLPLLTDFGLLEFFGSMMVKIVRPLFKIPGRASIDALASWVGDGTIGVLLTNKQYEEGNYTKREAAIIATTFSVVSITFSIVILEEVGLSQYFPQYYGTIVLCGIVLALLMPRLYPLRGKEDTYINGQPADKKREDLPKGHTVLSYGLENALTKAQANRNLGKLVVNGFKNVLDMWIAVAPVVMAFGTIALILATYTPIFKILGTPFEYYLAFLNIPEAAAAGQTMVVGFADMLLPAILSAGIESEMTRFVIATVSVTQLIYMSEIGGLILGTKLPINFKDLVVIFLLRTIISLPIIAGIAHLIF
ncbi:YjiH family protein [Caryophanon tenue]|uniref:Nucleoside transporter/FeoB GTPase Gate domain-containing protein n=1 Tax=Caryophanon tenue TaxID=33978 RepID=A0A1C0Y8C1_9BACL|nr:YjiH family protein [Caryophanon tenue]OCS83373.1 hypothetical protein A6M13_04940 [Caryophanon tenue]